ncbi:DUF6221 family protein [Streptomyces fructofermentans]|uniref:Uncharacterized protein n=1 Tax=Streptomyces fructofermentans TaxID=152141 RepID=A0A918NV92_9ACTN|nr:DUF6221 family protein [Streptomyces fructofermentans]GGX99158.1 hypothetical protein GCM10010515_76670 [Streptomyces fructofermentans]
MDELARWLDQRLAEDERDAQDRRGIFPQPGVDDDGTVWLHVRPGGNAVIVRQRDPIEGYDDLAKLRNWAGADNGWTQARVLREIEAKRRVLSDFTETARLRDEAASRIRAAGDHPDPGDLDTWDRAEREAAILEAPVRVLATVYRDRPGYRAEEWAP